MSIRQKTLLIISITVVILATALIMSSRFVIQESFNDLEEKYFQRNLDQVSSIVDDMLGWLVYTAIGIFCCHVKPLGIAKMIGLLLYENNSRYKKHL